MDTLRRLRELERKRNAGAISEAAFETARARLLDEVPEAEESRDEQVAESPSTTPTQPAALASLALVLATVTGLIAAALGASGTLALTLGTGALGAITFALFRQIEDGSQ